MIDCCAVCMYSVHHARFVCAVFSVRCLYVQRSTWANCMRIVHSASLCAQRLSSVVNYRPQTKFAKDMFLQVSVCPRGGACVVAHRGGVWLLWRGVRDCSGGHAWLLRGGVCMVAPRGACMVAPRGHALLLPGGGCVWLLWGGMHGCSGGGMHCCSQGGHAWLLQGGRALFF